MKKFVVGIFLTAFLFGSCAKPKCPTYMTPQEFARYEDKRMQKGRTVKRNNKGNIKKRKVSVDRAR